MYYYSIAKDGKTHGSQRGVYAISSVKRLSLSLRLLTERVMIMVMRLMTKLMMTLITNLPLPEDDEDDSTFTITVDNKTFHFQAKDSEERERWIRGLEDTVLRHNQLKRRYKKM